MQIFFSVALDPTQKSRQGYDVGPQYRSVIFATDLAQATLAQSYIAQLDAAHAFGQPIATRKVSPQAWRPEPIRTTSVPATE